MTGGIVGSAPDWYLLLLAADRCNVPPWVMADAPVEWIHRALAAIDAENAAAKTANGNGDKRTITL